MGARSAEADAVKIVLTLFAKRHLVYPSQNAAYQSLRQLRRMAEQRPDAFAEVERVWHSYATGEAMCDGPVAVTHNILRWVGWHWQALGLFACEGLGLPESWWLREVRQGLRLAEWKKAGTRRRDMRDTESTKALNSSKVPPEQTNHLRELLCGCVWTQKKGSLIATRADSPVCLFCGEEP